MKQIFYSVCFIILITGTLSDIDLNFINEEDAKLTTVADLQCKKLDERCRVERYDCCQSFLKCEGESRYRPGRCVLL